MTIAQILKFAVTKLSAGGITGRPRLEAEILLSHVLKKPREFLLAHGEKKLSSLKIANFKLLISNRLKGEPAAYLIGHKEFYGLNFKVNKNVLIPRPETELLVEEALKLITHSPQPITLVDVGTGSGCIIIALAKQIANCKFFAADISAKALAVARQNARAQRVNKNIKFIKGNLLAPLIHNSLFIIHNSLIILANLPYLAPAQIKNSPSIKCEPRLALNAGPDGLKYYKKLFQQIKELRAMSCELRDLHILCEIDPGQTKKIKQLIRHELPKAALQIKKDLSGLNRLAVIKTQVNQNSEPYSR